MSFGCRNKILRVNLSTGNISIDQPGEEFFKKYLGGTTMIAFAMECCEKGTITLEDTDGLNLSFGNHESMLKLIEMIAKREGNGNILAEGNWRAAKHFGKGAEKFSMSSKGMEFAAHEPHGKWNIGLGYTVSPNGADHMVVEHDHCFIDEPNTDPDAIG